jgi:putative transposase
LVNADSVEPVSGLMQTVAGEFAQFFNRRKGRSGGFWEDRFHSTMIDEGQHLWNCTKYVDLNMVRAGAVKHPSEWRWDGYSELMGLRQRYRLLDMEKLLQRLPRALPKVN